MRSGVSGLASTALAISPATSARSSLFASSSGTFSVLPLVLRVSMRRRGSCALTTSAKASPNTGKPPPGVAVPRTSTKISSISLRRNFGVLDDLLVDVDLAAHELGEIDRKSTRLNSSHQIISYAVFCLKKKTTLPNSHNHL